MPQRLFELELLKKTNPGINQVHVFEEIDSTNNEARRIIESGAPGVNLVVADSQTAGRGRRGRAWVSPAGGLYLSLTSPMPAEVRELQALSLVAAISTRQSLDEWSLRETRLKWPNDIMIGDKKIAGILLELQRCKDVNQLIFGIGINYSLSAGEKADIDRPVIDLREVTEVLPSRGQVIAKLCANLLQNVERFIHNGFSPFKLIWNKYDQYLGSGIVIKDGKSEKNGKSLGVNEKGELMLVTEHGEELITGGEVAPSLQKLNRSKNCDT